MTGIEQYCIALDGNKTVFRPGEQVNGRICLKLGRPMKIKTIVLGFFGQGRVEKKVGKTRYINREEYFSDGRLLYDECQDPHLMGNYPAGEYAFPFSFRFPSISLPTSFQGEYGYIRYWLDCKIGRPFLHRSEVQTALLTLVEPVNIDDPSLRSARQNQDNTSVCCCCCAAGSINTLSKIDRGAYYPGEEVHAKMYVENMSSRDVTYTEVALDQIVTFKYGKDSGDYTRRRETVARVTGPGVPKHQEESIENLKLVIPAFQPTTKSSTIISIEYAIKLIAHVKGSCVCASDVTIPITIGRAGSGPMRGLNPELIRLLVSALNQEASNDAQEVFEGERVEDNRVDAGDREMICQA